MSKTQLVQSHRLEQHTLSDLVQCMWGNNPRRHDLEAIDASLGKFGYAQPLLIDDTSGRIVAGHGVLSTLQLAADDGREPPERVQVRDGKWLVQVVHIQLAPGEADAYSIADTRTIELGGWHDELLLAVLTELADQDALTGTGFYPDDLTALQARISGTLPASFHKLPDQNPAQPRGAGKEVTCPECGHRFTA